MLVQSAVKSPSVKLLVLLHYPFVDASVVEKDGQHWYPVHFGFNWAVFSTCPTKNLGLSKGTNLKVLREYLKGIKDLGSIYPIFQIWLCFGSLVLLLGLTGRAAGCCCCCCTSNVSSVKGGYVLCFNSLIFIRLCSFELVMNKETFGKVSLFANLKSVFKRTISLPTMCTPDIENVVFM